MAGGLKQVVMEVRQLDEAAEKIAKKDIGRLLSAAAFLTVSDRLNSDELERRLSDPNKVAAEQKHRSGAEYF